MVTTSPQQSSAVTINPLSNPNYIASSVLGTQGAQAQALSGGVRTLTLATPQATQIAQQRVDAAQQAAADAERLALAAQQAGLQQQITSAQAAANRANAEADDWRLAERLVFSGRGFAAAGDTSTAGKETSTLYKVNYLASHGYESAEAMSREAAARANTIVSSGVYQDLQDRISAGQRAAQELTAKAVTGQLSDAERSRLLAVSQTGQQSQVILGQVGRVVPVSIPSPNVTNIPATTISGPVSQALTPNVSPISPFSNVSIVSPFERAAGINLATAPSNNLVLSPNYQRTISEGSGSFTAAVDLGNGQMQDYNIRYSNGKVINYIPLGNPQDIGTSRSPSVKLERQKTFNELFGGPTSQFERAAGIKIIPTPVQKTVPVSDILKSFYAYTPLGYLSTIAEESGKKNQQLPFILRVPLSQIEKTKLAGQIVSKANKDISKGFPIVSDLVIKGIETSYNPIFTPSNLIVPIVSDKVSPYVNPTTIKSGLGILNSPIFTPANIARSGLGIAPIVSDKVSPYVNPAIRSSLGILNSPIFTKSNIEKSALGISTLITPKVLQAGVAGVGIITMPEISRSGLGILNSPIFTPANIARSSLGIAPIVSEKVSPYVNPAIRSGLGIAPIVSEKVSPYVNPTTIKSGLGIFNSPIFTPANIVRSSLGISTSPLAVGGLGILKAPPKLYPRILEGGLGFVASPTAKLLVQGTVQATPKIIQAGLGPGPSKIIPTVANVSAEVFDKSLGPLAPLIPTTRIQKEQKNLIERSAAELDLFDRYSENIKKEQERIDKLGDTPVYNKLLNIQDKYEKETDINNKNKLAKQFEDYKKQNQKEYDKEVSIIQDKNSFVTYEQNAISDLQRIGFKVNSTDKGINITPPDSWKNLPENWQNIKSIQPLLKILRQRSGDIIEKGYSAIAEFGPRAVSQGFTNITGIGPQSLTSEEIVKAQAGNISPISLSFGKGVRTGTELLEYATPVVGGFSILGATVEAGARGTVKQYAKENPLEVATAGAFALGKGLQYGYKFFGETSRYQLGAEEGAVGPQKEAFKITKVDIVPGENNKATVAIIAKSSSPVEVDLTPAQRLFYKPIYLGEGESGQQLIGLKPEIFGLSPKVVEGAGKTNNYLLYTKTPIDISEKGFSGATFYRARISDGQLLNEVKLGTLGQLKSIEPSEVEDLSKVFKGLYKQAENPEFQKDIISSLYIAPDENEIKVSIRTDIQAAVKKATGLDIPKIFALEKGEELGSFKGASISQRAAQYIPFGYGKEGTTYITSDYGPGIKSTFYRPQASNVVERFFDYESGKGIVGTGAIRSRSPASTGITPFVELFLGPSTEEKTFEFGKGISSISGGGSGGQLTSQTLFKAGEGGLSSTGLIAQIPTVSARAIPFQSSLSIPSGAIGSLNLISGRTQPRQETFPILGKQTPSLSPLEVTQEKTEVIKKSTSGLSGLGSSTGGSRSSQKSETTTIEKPIVNPIVIPVTPVTPITPITPVTPIEINPQIISEDQSLALQQQFDLSLLGKGFAIFPGVIPYSEPTQNQNPTPFGIPFLGEEERYPKRKKKAKLFIPKGYEVLVKKKKKFVPVPSKYSFPENEAELLAMKTLFEGPEATAKIVLSKKPLRPGAPQIRVAPAMKALFRPGRGAGEIVQRERSRIITAAEKAGISFKGAEAKRASRKPYKKKKKNTKASNIRVPVRVQAPPEPGTIRVGAGRKKINFAVSPYKNNPYKRRKITRRYYKF